MLHLSLSVVSCRGCMGFHRCNHSDRGSKNRLAPNRGVGSARGVADRRRRVGDGVGWSILVVGRRGRGWRGRG